MRRLFCSRGRCGTVCSFFFALCPAACLCWSGCPRLHAGRGAGAGSKVWLGREAEFEAFLKTPRSTRRRAIPVGVTRPRRVFFAPGGLAAAAVFKPLQPGRTGGFFESYKSEIAAYELDKILGLGMVPPTVERRYNGDTGSLQLWVEHSGCSRARTRTRRPASRLEPPGLPPARVGRLTANIDRNAGNLLVDPAWNLILIDHSRAFTTDTRSLPAPPHRSRAATAS